MELSRLADSVKVAFESLGSNDVDLYKINGRHLFEIRDDEGRVKPEPIFYLVTKKHGKWYKFGVEIVPDLSVDQIQDKMKIALDEFREFLSAVEFGTV